MPCVPVKSPNDEKQYRVITLSNGLRALLISDQQSEMHRSHGLAPNVSQNGEHSAHAEADKASCIQQAGQDANVGKDAGRIESDDEDSSWTDISSDSNTSASSASHYSTSDSAGNNKRVGGKKRSQHNHSMPNVHSCSGEKLSAAGLCVGIGSFCDPTEIPGLAHFLEHMVFMGSQKYKNDNDFDMYVTEHGGSSNAFTDCEQTVFHFDIQKNYFYAALDRFAQFFIEPLMKKGSVDRELEAVDSEFRLSLTSDKNRIEQLLCSLANRCHPLSKFMWGNMESLKHCPQSRKVDIYKTLQKFRLKYYLPQYMTLAVQSQDSLDQLESWVKELFCAIPRSSEEASVSFQHLPAPFSGPQFTRLFRVVPVKTMNQLLITWSLPSQIQHYGVKPLHYLGWLVGYEGKGSLASYLKQRHWAVDVESGNAESGMEHNSTCSLFSVIITLTDEGLDQLCLVAEAVFQFLSILRCAGPQKYIYDEIKTIEDNEFRFQEPDDPQDNVEQLCVDMQHYAVKHYITGSRLMLEYNEQVIQACMELLTADRANVMVLSKRYDKAGFCDQREKWFKTPYKVDDIPEDWMKKWLCPDDNSHLHLPKPNPYIACDFEIKPADRDNCNKHPVLICDTAVCRLWYKKDDKFNVPRAYICLYLRIPVVSQSARNMCLTDLYVKLLNHNIAHVTYDAEIAGLSNEVKVLDRGIVVKFGGFSDKLPLLLRAVVDYVADLTVTEKDFEVVKHDLSMLYINQSLKPHKLNQDIRLSLLLRNRWLLREKYAELSCIDCCSLAQFAKTIFNGVFVESLIQGNFTAKEAVGLQDYLMTRLQLQPPASVSDTNVVVCQLPSDSLVFRLKNKNDADNNCVITNYYQHGPCNIDQYVVMELLMAFMDEPCFDWLRTRKQLGYYVDSSIRCTHGILGYSITVSSHSSKFSMKYLDDEIESFLVDLAQRIIRMKRRRFQHLVKSLVKQKCIEDSSLAEEVDRNWSEVLEQNYIFDRTEREIESLNKVTMEDFKQWALSHLHSGCTDSRKLSIQVVGNKTAKTAKKNDVNSTHNKRRTSKAKAASTTLTESHKSKTTQVTKSKPSANITTEATDVIADPTTKTVKSKTTADSAVEATKSKASADNCTETLKSKAVAGEATVAIETTVAIDTAAAACEGEDTLSQAVFNTVPQSSAAVTRKPNVVFVDSVNSFRYSSQWYSPSKVLP